MSENTEETEDVVVTIIIVVGVFTIGYVFYVASGLTTAGLALLAFAGLIFLIDHFFGEDEIVENFGTILSAMSNYEEKRESKITVSGKEEKLQRSEGLPLHPSTELRVTEVEHESLRSAVRDKKREGWNIAEIDNGDDSVVMYTSKSGGLGGHALVGLFTGLWTFGIGNYIYEKGNRRRNRKKTVLRADDLESEHVENKDDPNQEVQTTESSEPPERLRELKALHEDGVISSGEFEQKKAEILEEL